MKVGSLVELVNDKWGKKEDFPGIVNYPKKGVIYTIRDIISNKRGTYCHLEEIVNPIIQTLLEGTGETWFSCKRFRELQPPIANIEEHINENTLTPELI
jgi:hypothetical protein